MFFKFWKKENKGKVYVGLSGGVDSAVSAYLLKKQGYDVYGVFIETWQPDFIDCTMEEDKRSAMNVASYLDIPFIVFDAKEIYKNKVGDYMIESYRQGLTPNPDILCNSEIKFGVFYDFAISQGADFIATGHYVQVKRTHEKYFLAKGIDPSKDQSYFLAGIDAGKLAKLIFPLGKLLKSEVRRIAKSAGLPNSSRKDSQGVCMLGDLDIKDFLSHYIEKKRGEVLNTRGKVIGFHDGAYFLTLGERHGFTITQKSPEDSRYYIVKKDILKNEIVVSNTKEEELFASDEIVLSDFKLFDKINLKSHYQTQIRYHGELYETKILEFSENIIKIKLNKKIIIADGQLIVIYCEDKIVLSCVFHKVK